MGLRIFYLRPDGSHVILSSEAIPGAVMVRQGRILPANPILRFVFNKLRKWFGDKGRVAEWTRHWRCWWDVHIIDGPVLGPFLHRHEAGAAELGWILDREIKRDRSRANVVCSKCGHSCKGEWAGSDTAPVCDECSEGCP